MVLNVNKDLPVELISLPDTTGKADTSLLMKAVRTVSPERFLIALISLSAFLGFLRFDGIQVGMFYDDARYIILSESIATGQGYRLISFPYAPAEEAFPPGWPLLLAPFTYLFPGNYTVMKVLSFLFVLATIPLMYSLFAAFLKRPYRELAVALAALNPLMIGAMGTVMSESAYLFFSLLALKLFILWEREKEPSTYTYWLLGLAVVATALYAQLTRTIGFSLLLAIFSYLLLARRFRLLASIFGVVAIGILPQVWINLQRGSSLSSPSYERVVLNLSAPLEKLAQMLDNLQHYTLGQVISGNVIPIFRTKNSDILGSIIGATATDILFFTLNLLILGLIGAGFVYSWRRRSIVHLYVIFYGLALLAFWYPDGAGVQPRLLIPLLPFLSLTLCSVVAGIASYLKGRSNSHTVSGGIGAGVLWALTLLIISMLIIVNLYEWQNPLRNRATDISVGAEWLAENTSVEAVIMSPHPELTYLYARRKTVFSPASIWDAAEIKAYMERHKVDYVLVAERLRIPRPTGLDAFTREVLLPLLADEPDVFQLVHRDQNHAEIYRVDLNLLRP
jgi:4-amino-4-deoxy-L-arabinose transferase-like glycosyltransferase